MVPPAPFVVGAKTMPQRSRKEIQELLIREILNHLGVHVEDLVMQDQPIREAAGQSEFDQVYFWERVGDWHERLDPW